MAFAGSCDDRSDYFEIGCSLVDGKIAKTYWHVSEQLQNKESKITKLLEQMQVEIKAADGETIYELAIPFGTELMSPIVSGSELRMALVINDNDGNGRNGYLHWAQGMAAEKNPDKYGKLIFVK